MGWRIDEIEGDWLGGSRFALASHETLVEDFNRVEKILGREWIFASRVSPWGNIVRGLGPTLRVATMGKKLTVLEGINGGLDRLVGRILHGDLSAEAELTAIYLLRSQSPTAKVELYPRVGERESDFRIAQDEKPWAYVEVAQPDASEAEKQARAILERIAELVKKIKKPFALEVFLRREPSEQELLVAIQVIPGLCNLEGAHQQELPKVWEYFFSIIRGQDRFSFRIIQEKSIAPESLWRQQSRAGMSPIAT